LRGARCEQEESAGRLLENGQLFRFRVLRREFNVDSCLGPVTFGVARMSNSVQRFRKSLIQKELVALTRIEPVFAALQRFL